MLAVTVWSSDTQQGLPAINNLINSINYIKNCQFKLADSAPFIPPPIFNLETLI